MIIFLPLKNSTKSGQIYLDILITVAILTILLHALISLILLSFELISFTRARTTAKHLAQEKIELIRNLSYDIIGTSGGIPSGDLPQTEQISRNGLNYTVKTGIVYIDHSFDNQTPDDPLPTDFKRVRIDVSWEGLAKSATNPITFITDISPKGVETTVGGGTLSILVFNAQGEPVPQAQVNVTAPEVTPAIDLSLETNDDGRIILPGAPACTSCYQVSVAKTGYSSNRTYSTEEIVNPHKPHLTILEGQLTEISFAIDKVGRLAVASSQNREHEFALLPNIIFRLKGEKVIGTDINDNPVYKYEQEFATDDYGRLIITDLEWDNYNLFLPEGSTWDICGANPLLPIILLPDQELDFTFALNPHTEHSLLAIFTDVSQQPIASVAAALSDGLGLTASGSSGLISDPDFGQIFFSNLENRPHHLEATAPGFIHFSGNIDISGQTQEAIILEEE